MSLNLSNVINISVSQAAAGAGSYNTSNVAIFSDETPGVSFGILGYALYKSPTQVGVDFGTSSETYKMAVAVFSQSPNILANNGSLVVILKSATVTDVVPQFHVDFSDVPIAGQLGFSYDGEDAAQMLFSDNAATLQTLLRAVTGLGSVTVTGDFTAGFTIVMTGVTDNTIPLTIFANSLDAASSENVIVTLTNPVVGVNAASGETLAAAITRTEGLVAYTGIMSNAIETEAHMLAAAAVVQAMNKIALFVSRNSADIAPAGRLDKLRTGGYTKSRGLYHGVDNDSDALVMMASYAGRAFSVNFTGSNTTTTMHLKDLAGVQPDPTMTQTRLGQCVTAGVDTYVSLQGVAKVFCSGKNSFFDQVYNLVWLTGALEIAGFNYLAQSATKIPQTEDGISGLKGAYRKVMEQSVANQYIAPGAWNSAVTFGNQEDFLLNINQAGYYIYSTPIALQAQADREARIAPLIQIAAKEAGAVHSSTVIVNITA